MPDNVIDVDFAAAQTAALDPLDEAGRILSEAWDVANEIQKIERFAGWDRRQADAYRRRVRELERQLTAERRIFKLDDEAVLDALRGVGEGEPVHATSVARTLFPAGVTHSVIVRVGLALGRLERRGRVRRFEPERSHRSSRWQAVDA